MISPFLACPYSPRSASYSRAAHSVFLVGRNKKSGAPVSSSETEQRGWRFMLLDNGLGTIYRCKCHLATPKRNRRCIHCGQNLAAAGFPSEGGKSTTVGINGAGFE